MKTILTTLGVSLLVLAGCTGQKQAESNFIQENIDNAVAQETIQTDIIEKSGKILNPRTINKDGSIVYVPIDDWCSGFFPGNIWYTYELTGDKKWLPLAEKYTEALDSVQYLTWHHDVGFMVGCSYLNGYRFTNKEEYKPVIIQTAKSLSTRFRPAAGVLQSWDADKGWQAQRGWKCPVIIDNMMNLELLFWASKATGDPSFRNIAISHAEKTMKYQIRKDGSSYHLACYDPETGNFIKGETSQGYSNESTWSRGQGWGIYGFTLCYRETKDPRFLKTAQRMADYYINHPNLPSDKIPWWDFDTHRPGFIPGKFSKTNKYIQNYRDASAASVTASALLELSSYVKDDKKKIYTETALQILTSLSSPEYRAEEGKNGNFILKHSTGAIPHGSEVDVPLIYADYYFLEALLRYNRMINNKPIL